MSTTVTESNMMTEQHGEPESGKVIGETQFYSVTIRRSGKAKDNTNIIDA